MLHDAWRGRGVKLQESTYNTCCMMPGGEGGVKLQESTYKTCCMMPGGEGG